MANYVKLTDFASKDALPTGNASKIVKGTEIDDEFEAIKTAIQSKADVTGGSQDVTVNSVIMGNWSFQDNGSTILNIKYNGTNVFELDSSGNLTVAGTISANGTV